MLRVINLRAIGIALTLCVANVAALAQTSPAKEETQKAKSQVEQIAADRKMMKVKAAEVSQKRAECKKQAAAQKLHLLKRKKFIDECMKK